MEYVVIVIVIYVILKLLFRKRTIKTSSISIGMSPDEVRRAIGRPAKSDGLTVKENWTKEVLYYGPNSDKKTNKTTYDLRVVYINGKASEIHAN